MDIPGLRALSLSLDPDPGSGQNREQIPELGPLPAPSYQNRTLGLGPIWGPLGLGCSLRRGWLLLAMQHYISVALY